MPELPGRLLLVSNRLPITIHRSTDSSYEFSMTSGGLATGLSGLQKSATFQWYGWPGMEIPENEVGHLHEKLRDEYDAVPVLLNNDLANKYYNGFCNSIIWPVLHYHLGDISFNETAWKAYQKANRLFAKAVAENIADGDLVWVHDFHLMLLPSMLREEIELQNKIVKIGFFLHTPFPSAEIFRILPVRREILEGVLHSDLIGFHTHDYVRHFLSSCARVLGSSTTPNGVKFRGNFVRVGAFPLGIEPEKFELSLQKPQIQERITALEQRFQHIQFIIGVDRLDYVKGIPQKLHAFEIFLSNHPEYVGKVVLVQVAVPSRESVEEYRNLITLVNELVGRINGTFGNIDYTPIHFIHKSVSFDELIALFAVSDACVVSSTRDGMNLVSYEYIATQQKRHGTLILSEFAGAAQALNGSLIVNPWHTEKLADAIHKAITLSKKQREINYQKLRAHIFKHTSASWGEAFVSELTDTVAALEETRNETNSIEYDKNTHEAWDPAEGFDGSIV